MEILDILQKLRDEAMSLGVEFADFRFVEQEFDSIELEDKKVSKVRNSSVFGVGIRVLVDGAWAFASVNSIDIDKLRNSLDLAIKKAKATREYVDLIGVVAKVEPTIDKVKAPYKIDPRSIPIKEKMKKLIQWEKDAIAIAPYNYFNSYCNYIDQYWKEIVCNTFGTLLENEIIRVKSFAVCIAKEGDIKQRGFSFAGGVGGYELLERLNSEDFGVRAAKDAIELLSAEPSIAGKFPVVLDNTIIGLFTHEAFGHNAEADLVQGGESILRGKLNTQIASPLVNIIDDATLEGKHGTFLYDSEGTPAKRTVLIENGILKGFMHNIETAGRAGVEPTGNGRAQDHRYPPIVRMSNTFIEPGEMTLDELLKPIDLGVFIQGFGGGYVYVERGQYTCTARRSWMIRNGELAEPLRDVRISGMTLETLMNIDGLSKDFAIKEPGTCGKNGQGMPVDNGGPCVRVKEMVVGGQR